MKKHKMAIPFFLMILFFLGSRYFSKGMPLVSLRSEDVQEMHLSLEGSGQKMILTAQQTEEMVEILHRAKGYRLNKAPQALVGQVAKVMIINKDHTGIEVVAFEDHVIAVNGIFYHVGYDLAEGLTDFVDPIG